MNHIVYILESLKDGSKYIGYTTDLKQRIHDHNNDSNIYSSSRKPWKVIWHCVFLEKEKAKEFEKYLKHGSEHAFAKKHLI